MQTTFTELVLTPVYRHAQRTLSLWLDSGHDTARRMAFQARTAIAALDATDRHRLARWLAWMALAERSRGGQRLDAHLQRLDGTVHHQVQEALGRLPLEAIAAVRRERLSA